MAYIPPQISSLLAQLRPLSILVGITFVVGTSSAQDSGIPSDVSPSGTSSDQAPGSSSQQSFASVYSSIKRANPNRRAGMRSSLLSQSMQVMPVVVIVDEPSAYLDAIAGWEGQTRYPVLFDDGTDLSRENIARFVRAFDPDEVIRITEPGKSQWGTTSEKRLAAIDASFAAAIQESEPDWRKSIVGLKSSGIVSPGVVVLDSMDHHWAGGLALAAGHIQPIIYINGTMNQYRELTPSLAESINETIRQSLIQMRLSHNTIGDDIDLITLAFRTGIKIKTGPQDRDRLATTDWVGRNHNSGGLRWAWCGQLFGSTSTGVYQAMCSLFLPIDSAFIWDGYPNTGEWAKYDGTKANEELINAGFETELFDDPRNSLASFRARGDSRPVDASLILMNTKGAQNYYDLPKAPEGIGKPGDLPLLSKPSAIHIVHSFSLSLPHNDKTVGGRWLDRGVYLYAGSVDEPYLSGFVPTPVVANRLVGQLPFASAVHYDDGPVWKIAVIGDPFKTVSQCGTRIETTPELIQEWIKESGGGGVEDQAKALLKEGEFSRAIESFVFAGRDDAVVRLAKALIADKPEGIDDQAGKAIIQAAMRQGEHELVLDAFESLSVQSRSHLPTLDALWFAGRYRLSRFDDRRALALLRTNLRERQEIFDAEQLGMHIRRDSLNEAIAFMETLRSTTSPNERKQLDQAINRVRR